MMNMMYIHDDVHTYMMMMMIMIMMMMMIDGLLERLRL